MSVGNHTGWLMTVNVSQPFKMAGQLLIPDLLILDFDVQSLREVIYVNPQ